MLTQKTLPLFLSLALIALSAAVVIANDADETLKPLIAKVRPSIATIQVRGRDGGELGMGTGFVIDPEGLIATNLHVISEGRAFDVEMSSGRKLKVLAVEASNRASDLALVRVDVDGEQLSALSLAEDGTAEQGMRVLAFGNPLGLRHSVVEGIISAVREVDGRELIQLAMPIERGNSGGPLVDTDGRVHGIINMKSAVTDNLGFAIPVEQLSSLREQPNPVAIDRWVLLGRMNQDRWTTLFGGKWQQRGGIITAEGQGEGFGGRSLCISKETLPKEPYDIAVMVRLNDESGAAGLAFHSDGNDRHYGFYPSSGKLRLTCFRGASVYSWQVLHDQPSPHYLPNQWNRLRVRFEPERFRCYVNGHLVVESSDQQLSAGQVGLCKFRDTNPEFRQFRIGPELAFPSLPQSAHELLEQLDTRSIGPDAITSAQIQQLGEVGDAASLELISRAFQLEQQASQLRRLASDVQRVNTLKQLSELMKAPSTDEQSKHDAADEANKRSESDEPANEHLLKGALLIAALDNPELDVEAYEQQVDAMASEIRGRFDEQADEATRRAALDTYLFEENGFHGGSSEYYHRANSHLNRVIDDREGLPITMSILYMELGLRLGLNVKGVGLPGHFIVKSIGSGGEAHFVDVFERGRQMSRSDAADTVAAFAGRELREEDLRSQTDVEILSRVLNNLMGVASRNEDMESMLRYCEALVAINPSTAEFRMLRARLRGLTERKNAAIEDLDWLLDHDPPGLDRDRVQLMRAALQTEP